MTTTFDNPEECFSQLFSPDDIRELLGTAEDIENEAEETPMLMMGVPNKHVNQILRGILAQMGDPGITVVYNAFLSGMVACLLSQAWEHDLELDEDVWSEAIAVVGWDTDEYDWDDVGTEGDDDGR